MAHTPLALKQLAAFQQHKLNPGNRRGQQAFDGGQMFGLYFMLLFLQLRMEDRKIQLPGKM